LEGVGTLGVNVKGRLIALATWNRQYKIKHSNYELNSEACDIRYKAH
jgi:hypothetical protein